jgi:uncharacterized cupredoxin-like copper-binding protein
MLVSCQIGPTLPPQPQTVNVIMREYSFDVQTSIKKGRAVFVVSNAGQLDHQLTLEKLPAGFPPILEQVRGNIRRSVPTVALMPEHGPGTTATFAVDLTPGRYALVCLTRDEDGVSHSAKGMATEFTVH